MAATPDLVGTDFGALAGKARQLAASREVQRALREQADSIRLQQAGHARLMRSALEVLADEDRPGAAVRALRSAVAKGVSDAAAIDAEADFASLRGDEQFRELLRSLKFQRR